MPRDANGAFYYPPGTQAEPFTTANSSDVNSRFNAVKDDLNSGPVLATRLTGTIPEARLPGSVVRTVTAGDGMTVTGSGTSTIALAVASSVVRTSRQIATGTGLTGGGSLSADRTLSFDTAWGDARYAMRGRTISAGSGLTGGGDLGANRSLAVDNTVLRTTGDQTKNGGLTIQGYAPLQVKRTGSIHNATMEFTNDSGSIWVGQGSSQIFGVSNNIDVSATRKFSVDTKNGNIAWTGEADGQFNGTTLRKELARVSSAGAVGTYMFARQISGSTGFGSTVAGSSLRPANTGSGNSSTVPSGTWRCMGHGFDATSTLWIRLDI